MIEKKKSNDTNNKEDNFNVEVIGRIFPFPYNFMNCMNI
jgi:hypothetical protein